MYPATRVHCGYSGLALFIRPIIESEKCRSQRIFRRIPALIISIFDFAAAMIRQPVVHLQRPAFRQIEVVQPPCGILYVVECCLEFLLRVIAFIQDWVFVHSLGEFVVGAEGVGDFAVAKNPNTEAIDVANGQ